MWTVEHVYKCLESQTLYKLKILSSNSLLVHRRVMMHGKNSFYEYTVDETSTGYRTLLELSKLKEIGEEFEFREIYERKMEKELANVDLKTLCSLIDDGSFEFVEIRSDGNLELYLKEHSGELLLYSGTPQFEFIISKTGKLIPGQKHYFK